MIENNDLIHSDRLLDVDNIEDYQPHIASPEDHDVLFRHNMHDNVEAIGPCEEKMGLKVGSMDCGVPVRRKAAIYAIMAHYNTVRDRFL